MNPVYIYHIEMERRAVSFLSPPQVKALGGLPKDATIALSLINPGRGLPQGVEYRPIWFITETFLKLMHRVIQNEGPSNPGLLADARGKRDGDLYVVDLRNTEGSRGLVAPVYIVGGFKVRDGKIIGESYRPNPIYQVFSAHGWPHLSRSLHEPLMKAMCEAEPGSASLEPALHDLADPSGEAKPLLSLCDYCGAKVMPLDGRCPQCQNLSAGARYIIGVEAKIMFPGGSFLDRPWQLYEEVPDIPDKEPWYERKPGAPLALTSSCTF